MQEVPLRSRLLLTTALFALSCTPGEEGAPREDSPGEELAPPATSPEVIVARELERIEVEVARIDAIFQPLPLLRAAQEDALRRFGNPQQLQRARALGIDRLLPPERLEELRREGSLVVLEDTEHWVVREMDHSRPLVIPSVHSLLTRIGERFQTRLAELGAPPFRLEVTSALRTAEDQTRLRQVNPNAAFGESTHEHGTTVDVLYSAFSAPSRSLLEIDTSGAEWLEPYIHRHMAVAAERVAARRALELKAILGEVLLEIQDEGLVMVTLEQLQPVFHMTVSTRF